jgi:CheY-like chemotaxis protein
MGTQYLENILGEARKATDLVQQILDFGRRTEIENRPLNLADLVAKVVAILARTLPENIHIISDVAPGRLMIRGDAGRLQQALTNLALNARDAMPNGGTLRIGLTRIATTPGDPPPMPEMEEVVAPPVWICLSVADTGSGMTAEAYAHLFEPFFTTKEAGRGTGLGLAQVYGIVQLHSGYIDVENTVGEGVTFRIYLPAADVVTEGAIEAVALAPPGHGETLLLVEDNAQLREAGQTILRDLGYRVLTVTNGREALELWQQESDIALLITDLVMPEMSGKALMQALRSQRPDLKALAMTGYTQDRDDDLLAAGFLDVIHKPFDVINLATAVREALDKA